MTVSGLTIASAERQSRQMRDSPIDPQYAVSSGQFWAFSRGPLQHTDLMAQS
jgi:hypothetical protein